MTEICNMYMYMDRMALKSAGVRSCMPPTNYHVPGSLKDYRYDGSVVYTVRDLKVLRLGWVSTHQEQLQQQHQQKQQWRDLRMGELRSGVDRAGLEGAPAGGCSFAIT